MMSLVNARPLTLSFILASLLFRASTKFAYISFSFLYPVSFLFFFFFFFSVQYLVKTSSLPRAIYLYTYENRSNYL